METILLNIVGQIFKKSITKNSWWLHALILVIAFIWVYARADNPALWDTLKTAFGAYLLPAVGLYEVVWKRILGMSYLEKLN